MKPTIIVTGAQGLIGSQFVSLFKDAYTFEVLDSSHPTQPVDITNQEQVRTAIEGSTAEAVVHFAAYTDVTGAYNQTDDYSGPAYRVNVEGTKHVVEACKQSNKQLIHISTAYVFDGEKSEMYLETDPVNPIEWYGKTKAWAEEAALEYSNSTVLRIDQPFRSDTQVRPDIVRRVAAGIQNHSLYPQFTNHFFGPTFIDDLTKVIDWAIRTKSYGVFHASSGEQWSDYAFAQAVAQALELDGPIPAGNLDDYLKTLGRPYQKNTALDTRKLQSKIDFRLLSIAEALKKVVL